MVTEQIKKEVRGFQTMDYPEEYNLELYPVRVLGIRESLFGMPRNWWLLVRTDLGGRRRLMVQADDELGAYAELQRANREAEEMKGQLLSE